MFPPSYNTRTHVNCNGNRSRKSTFVHQGLNKAYVTSVATQSICRGAERREGATPSCSGSRCGCRHLVSEAPFCLLTTRELKGRRVKIPLLCWWLRVTQEQVQRRQGNKTSCLLVWSGRHLKRSSAVGCYQVKKGIKLEYCEILVSKKRNV